jgi:hypothetical protein
MISRQPSPIARQLLIALALCIALPVYAGPRKTVAVLEYRAGARGARDIGLKLARLLRSTAALTVIDARDARRKVPKVDAEVARCGGEAACVGKIGLQLGADEVLLVGVSQLGDIVIALSRIDASRGEAGARLAESLPPDGDVNDQQALTWLRQLFPPDVFHRYGSIAIDADQAGAEVSLNAKVAGTTPLLQPVKVPAPATYDLKVAKHGFVPFQARVDVLPDANVEVHATLLKESRDVPWYKRWYVWAVVGGALAAGGAATAIYFGTRVESSPVGYIDRKF